MHTMCPHPFSAMVGLIEELREKSIMVALITGNGKRSCDITLKQFSMETVFDRVETGVSFNRKSKSEAM